MTNPAQTTTIDPEQRARLCNSENANAIALRRTQQSGRSTAIVKTGNPLQPYCIYDADDCPPEAVFC